MDTFVGVLIFAALAAFVLRPMFRGFREGLQGDRALVSDRDDPRRTYSVDVVGESNYQHNLLVLAGGREPEGVEKFVSANLILEDDNPHDPQAVRVDVDSLTIGYLSRGNARMWRHRKPAMVTECRAVIRGGWDRGAGDRGHFGVWLKLP